MGTQVEICLMCFPSNLSMCLCGCRLEKILKNKFEALSEGRGLSPAALLASLRRSLKNVSF